MPGENRNSNVVVASNEKTYKQVFKEIVNEGLDSINNGTAVTGRTLKKILLENDFVTPLVNFSNESNKRKIEVFIENIIEDNSKEKILEFIDNLSDDDKIFFTEMIKKAIDLNDNFQIYILSCLFKNYESNIENNINPPFNYFEKKLYYSISSFSEDDFIIFWGVYKKYEDSKNEIIKKLDFKQVSRYLANDHSEVLEIKKENYVNEDIIYISLNRFANIGILTFVSKLQQKDDNRFDPSDMYKINPYAKTLFDYLDAYCVRYNKNCDELLKIKENKCDVSDWE